MRRKMSGSLKTIAVTALALTLWPLLSFAQVCSTGVGIPPFLERGAYPNLLLALDNSGSMLDMAYVDKTTYIATDDFEFENTCLDESYLYEDGGVVYIDGEDQRIPAPNRIYAGYFEQYHEPTPENPLDECLPEPVWYQWMEPIAWTNSTPYDNGDIVSSNGKLYQGTCIDTSVTSCNSSGTNVLDDANITWDELNRATVDQWDITKSDYTDGDIVIYNAKLYRAKGGTTTGTFNYGQWDLLEEGYFEKVARGTVPCGGDSNSYSYTIQYDATDPDGLTCTVNRKEVQIIAEFPGGDSSLPPTDVTCFAATGNFNNWAMASKFDIQKQVLTGGKYYAGVPGFTEEVEVDDGSGAPVEDFNGNGILDTALQADDLLISEHRGCSGKGFMKEIEVTNNTSATDVRTLTMRVRGPDELLDEVLDGPVDEARRTDYTTRIDIMGLTTISGGCNLEACARYVAELDALPQPNLALLETYMEQCLYATQPVQPVFNVYHSSIHDCWKIAKGEAPPHTGNLESQCEHIYQGRAMSGVSVEANNPWDIFPRDPHYICRGVWDPNDPPDPQNNYYGGRGGIEWGYIGRCWEDWPVSGAENCSQATCDGGSGDFTFQHGTWAEDEYYANIGGVGHACLGGLLYRCNDDVLTSLGGNPSCEGRSSFEAVNYVVGTTTECAGGESANGCADLWDLSSETCWGEVAPDVWNSDQKQACIEQAEYDYCSELGILQEIDASDAGETSSDGSDASSWGIVAALVDSGCYTQLGGETPIMTMKGHIKYEPEAVQLTDEEERPDGPRGVIYDVASDLRLGVMAFRQNGSLTECELLAGCTRPGPGEPFDVCTLDPNSAECEFCVARQSIEKFCPADNADGAMIGVDTQIELGMYVENGQEIWDHYNNVVAAINDVPAVTWTPLAEAMYAALGYFGQFADRRLYDGHSTLSPGDSDYDAFLHQADFLTATEDQPNWQDPVQYWCQENHILVITEGSSTADINSEVSTFATSNASLMDTDTDSVCQTGLEGSTYLDDLTFFGRDGVPYYLGEYTTPLPEPDHPDYPYPNRDLGDQPIWGPVCDPTDTTCNGQGLSPLFYELLPTGILSDDGNSQIWTKQPIQTHFVTTGTPRGADAALTDECSPASIMQNAADNGGTPLLTGEDPSELQQNLAAILGDIAQRTSAGSAASVVSASRSGEGAVYQAVFWPEVERASMSESPLQWVGDVHSVFIDDRGFLWDDYDGNGLLESDDINGNGIDDEGIGVLTGDRRIWYYFYDGNTRICFREPGPDPACLAAAAADPALDPEDCPEVCLDDDYTDDPDEPAEGPLINDFKYFVWSAAKSLNNVSEYGSNREFYSDAWGLDKWDWGTAFNQRFIFTWNDLNNDGIVNDGITDATLTGDISEIIELEFLTTPTNPDPAIFEGWDIYSPSYSSTIHHSLLEDFRAENATEFNYFVNWLRGDELFETAGTDTNLDGDSSGGYAYRCRKYPNCYDPDNPTVESDDDVNPAWLIGDVINSTPKVAAQAAEAFTVYGDPTYLEFRKRHQYRRTMVYFGTNSSGMLHAVNGGFKHPSSPKYWTNRVGTLLEDLCYYDYDVASGDVTDSWAPAATPGNDPCASVLGSAGPGPELGTEMWAYLPYNLQPHIRCTADDDFGLAHKYFVDKEPRLFDMQIFVEEPYCNATTSNPGYGPEHPGCIHPGGWGTILVGAMRFGGAPVRPADEDGWSLAQGNVVDNREFVSAYFVMDITDPEGPPRLLGELTRTTDDTCFATQFDSSGAPSVTEGCADLGFSVPMPTGVVMRDGTGDTEATTTTTWYLIFGNGPTTLKGENDQRGFVFALPMTWLSDVDGTLAERRAFRVPGDIPTGSDRRIVHGGGTILLPPAQQKDANGDYVLDTSDERIDDPTIPSFVSDMIAVDFNLTTQSLGFGGLYKTDAVYFGTVDGDYFDQDSNGDFLWDVSGGGRMLRLITRDVNDVPYTFLTSDDSDPLVYGYQGVTTPDQWEISTLLDAGEPITGAPSVAWDNSNFWVYFGTGRFFASEDKTDDATHHFFGVKEPLNEQCGMTWDTLTWDPDNWFTSVAAGGGGFVRSDNILVPQFEDGTPITGVFGNPVVYCDDDASVTSTDCDLGFLDDFVDDTDTAALAVTLDGSSTTDYYTFESLRQYIRGTQRIRKTIVSDGTVGQEPVYIQEICNVTDGTDGFFREFQFDRERLIGQSTLLGGLTTYTSYTPIPDICSAEGTANLYGVHYQTGTAWFENVFGLTGRSTAYGAIDTVDARYKPNLGRGLATTPSLFQGTGTGADAKAFIQTSTGEIIEIDQENLPIKTLKPGRVFWSDDENPRVLPGLE